MTTDFTGSHDFFSCLVLYFLVFIIRQDMPGYSCCVLQSSSVPTNPVWSYLCYWKSELGVRYIKAAFHPYRDYEYPARWRSSCLDADFLVHAVFSCSPD